MPPRLGAEITLRIAAPAPFYLPRTYRNFTEKTMVAEEVFVNCYNFNPITSVKKGNFQGTVSYKTIWSRRD
jgi:hypothetical protein